VPYAAAADMRGCGPQRVFGGLDPNEGVMAATRPDFVRECPPAGFEPALRDESLLSPLWSKLEELKARSVREGA
jgi:hypothetical protein